VCGGGEGVPLPASEPPLKGAAPQAIMQPGHLQTCTHCTLAGRGGGGGDNGGEVRKSAAETHRGSGFIDSSGAAAEAIAALCDCCR